jgi:hypothetical protein
MAARSTSLDVDGELDVDEECPFPEQAVRRSILVKVATPEKRIRFVLGAHRMLRERVPIAERPVNRGRSRLLLPERKYVAKRPMSVI